MGAEVEARAASARFAELPTVRPETQDEIDLGIDGMAIAVATGFEFEAFWAQAAVLYNEKAMAAMERSAEAGPPRRRTGAQLRQTSWRLGLNKCWRKLPPKVAVVPRRRTPHNWAWGGAAQKTGLPRMPCA